MIATDDRRIEEVVREFGGAVVLTDGSHQSGTDRIAEAVRDISVSLVINIQGDEPTIEPSMIDALIDAMDNDTRIRMATLVTPLRAIEELHDTEVVKVVMNRRGDALYFSRAPVPFPYRRSEDELAEVLEKESPFFCHVGIYGYRKECLMEFCSLAQTELEKTERLEQLRALENGIPIRTVVIPEGTVDVDVPEDIVRVETYLDGKNGTRMQER
jgi:3-deoxy-manno-octulosonate cytidylyltransferase (CMP-KDO synthetase)